MATLDDLYREADRRGLGSAPASPAPAADPLARVQAEAQRRAQASLPEGYTLLGTFANNGRVYRTPDGTRGAVSAESSTQDPDTVARIMAGADFAIPQQMAHQVLEDHPIAARANEVVRGVPFLGRWADEAVGLFSDRAADTMRAASDAMAQEHPYQTMGLNVTGGLLGAIPMAIAGAPALAKLPTGLLARMGLAATGGTVEGAVSGYGEGTGEERAQNAGSMAASGGLLGLAAPVIGGAVSGAVNSLAHSGAVRSALAHAPGLDALRNQARAMFGGAKGATFPRNQFTPAADAMLQDARRAGLDRDVTPAASGAARRIEDAATTPDPNITFDELDTLRAVATGAGNVRTNPHDAMLGTRLVEGIDNFLDSMDPALADQVREARQLWGQLRRSERLQEAIRRAGLSASGFENGLRNEFRAILKDPKRLRGFSDSEVKAMERVVKGSLLNRAMRFVGTAGFPTDQGRNFLGAAIGSAAGNAIAGPAGAVAFPAAATGFRAMTEASTRRAAERALDLATIGGLQYAPAITNATRGLLDVAAQGAGREPANTIWDRLTGPR